MLIFAYGSNLNPRQMEDRCPSWKYFARATLPGFGLTFAGHSSRWRGAVATIEKRPRSKVAGIIYSISSRDIDTLDAYEGHPVFYRRMLAPVETDIGTKLVVTTYELVTGADRPGLPSASYAAAIVAGYTVWGFDTRRVVRALKSSAKRAIESLQV